MNLHNLSLLSFIFMLPWLNACNHSNLSYDKKLYFCNGLDERLQYVEKKFTITSANVEKVNVDNDSGIILIRDNHSRKKYQMSCAHDLPSMENALIVGVHWFDNSIKANGYEVFFVKHREKVIIDTSICNIHKIRMARAMKKTENPFSADGEFKFKDNRYYKNSGIMYELDHITSNAATIGWECSKCKKAYLINRE